jgi:DNA-binding GntR family transcriptional regulator
MSSAETAYAQIRQAILSLRFRPGEKLSEARLASELGVGRSPVRTALARLASEGWIRVLPQSGTFVSELSPRDLSEVAELRLLLEPYTARIGAQAIGEKELRDLRAQFEDLRAKGLAGRFAEFHELDDRLHYAIHQAAGNQRIADILRHLHDQIHWVRVSTATLPGRVEKSFREMEQVLTALERRDSEAAEKAMREHIRNIARSFDTMPRKRQAASAVVDAKETL